jgi:predicted lysophospholipase L1 biosynthesis ABC-type transport system permease subunit
MLTGLKAMAARTLAFFRVRRLDRDLGCWAGVGRRKRLPHSEQEMESHLVMPAEENIRRGMTPAEAHPEARMRLYPPIRQTGDYSSVDMVVRTTLPPTALASALRGQLKSIDPNLPANEFRTLQQLVDKAVSPRRFVVIPLTGFSAFGLILASLGIYAVISYSVAQRTQELGIRMALGASAQDLQARIVLHTLGLAGMGMVLGISASWMLSRALRDLLFGVTSTDPATFVGMVVTLAAVAALAGYLPARQASRIDPMAALRAG